MESFKQATDLLRNRVNDHQADIADAENVLRRASVIDDLMARNRLDTSSHAEWQALRRDMDELARAYAITSNWSAASQNTPSRVDDRQVGQLLTQIGTKASRFDKSLGQPFESGQTDARRVRDEVRQSVADFRQATNRLRDRVDGRQSTTLDVEEVLRRGMAIDGDMQRYQLSTQAEQDWLSLRRDLDTLARAYNVAWNWSDPGCPDGNAGDGVRHRLTGTYQLENNRSDDPRVVARRAARAAPSNQRQATIRPPGPAGRARTARDRAQRDQRDDGVDTRSTRDLRGRRQGPQGTVVRGPDDEHPRHPAGRTADRGHDGSSRQRLHRDLRPAGRRRRPAR